MSLIDTLSHRMELLAASLLIGFFFVYISWRRQRKKSAKKASHEFRAAVLAELKGVYPIPRYLDIEVCGKFSQSIPKIESAAAEYRQFIPTDSKKAFNTALQDYREHCSRIRWESCVTYNTSRDRSNPEEIGPKEVFRQNVNALLSFTKNS